MSFYDKYVELCAAANIYPSVAAEEMGFHKSTVSSWKRRGNTPSALTVQTVAQYFNVPKSYFDETENAPKNVNANKPIDNAFSLASAEEKMDMAARLISSLTEEQQAAFIQRIMFKK